MPRGAPPGHTAAETQAEERDGNVHVELCVRELIGYDDIERVAEFVIRDGHAAAFVLPPLP